MSSLIQSSCLHSFHTKRSNLFHPTINITKPPIFKPQNSIFFALNCSKNESFLTPNSSNDSKDENFEETSKSERVKLALERAREYKKKSLQLEQNQDIGKDPFAKNESISSGVVVGDDIIDVGNEILEGYGDDGEQVIPEAVRRAMEKAKEYQKNKGVLSDDKTNLESDSLQGDLKGADIDVPEAVTIAMEKAKEYKENKETSDDTNRIIDNSNISGRGGGNANPLENRSIKQDTDKKGDLKISSIDFVGLSFSDKKTSRSLPAGLVPVSDPFSDGDLPEVEILVGDASKFGSSASSEPTTSSQDENSDLYKPKVSTWGMFPRPSNISKTFGGGRNIRPGEELETAEDKAAKEARTKQLIATYKRNMGLIMDPKLKAECEKALKDGDSLMDAGRLREALPYYQTVMDKLAFQTRLHGLAALQWSICQDSLSRPDKAKDMYEKLQSHPYVEVSKKARQFVFSFKAMEMMKVTRSTPSKNTGYQSYFEAFVEDKPNYTSESSVENEDTLNQAVLYMVFLASPILIVLFAALR